MTQPARWAQLSYTTFDGGTSITGGWQVKQESPGLSDAERKHLLDCITTSLEPPRAMGRFLSPDEVAALPRRLLLSTNDDGSCVLMHSAPAGADSFGRPGNVFSHGLLVRDLISSLSAPRPNRPLSWWRSPGWLTPYGPTQVREAEFDDRQPPPPADAIGAKDALDLLFSANPERRRTARLLLDATAAALSGGPPVAIVADDVDDGARWLSVPTFLASPQSSERLTFSTYERASVALNQGSEATLTVLLRSDVDEQRVQRPPLLVVDPVVRLELSEDGRRWRTGYEQEVPVSAWSELVDAVSELGRHEAERTLLAIDEISELNPEPARACPWWPLAVAVGEDERLETAWRTATEVLLSETPPSAELDLDTHALFVDLLQRASGTSRADAHALLTRLATASPDSKLLAAAYRNYLERTWSDPDALADAQPLALPKLPPRTRLRVVAELEPYIVETMELVAGEAMRNADWCVQILRRMALLELSGLPVAHLGHDVDTTLDRIARAMVTTFGRQVVEALPDLPPAIRALLGRFTGPAISARHLPPGSRLDGEVLDWFAVGYSTLALHMTREGGPPVSPLLQDLAVRRAQSDETVQPFLRLGAALALLDSEFWMPNGSPSQRVWEGLGLVDQGSPAWTPEELTWLLQYFRDRQDLDFASVIEQSVLAHGPGGASVALARMALREPGSPVTMSDFPRTLLWLVETLRPDWHREIADVGRTSVTIMRCGAFVWRFLDGLPFRERLAPHLLLAQLHVNADVNQNITFDLKAEARDSVPQALAQEIGLFGAAADSGFVADALRDHNWRLAEFLFLDAARRVSRPEDRVIQGLTDVFDLSYLLDHGTDRAADDVRSDRDDIDFFAPVSEAPSRAVPLVGKLLLPYFVEHERARLQDLLNLKLAFSASETRKVMHWINDLMRLSESLASDATRRKSRP